MSFNVRRDDNFHQSKCAALERHFVCLARARERESENPFIVRFDFPYADVSIRTHRSIFSTREKWRTEFDSNIKDSESPLGLSLAVCGLALRYSSVRTDSHLFDYLQTAGTFDRSNIFLSGVRWSNRTCHSSEVYLRSFSISLCCCCVVVHVQ